MILCLINVDKNSSFEYFEGPESVFAEFNSLSETETVPPEWFDEQVKLGNLKCITPKYDFWLRMGSKSVEFSYEWQTIKGKGNK